MSWAAGYNNSVAYTTGFYQEQSPTWLKACLVMQRVAPPAGGKFTYCELGFGQGLTSLILAATHPEGDFYACDFNPLHVMAASSVRDEAKLGNLTLLEHSFGQLADGEAALPMFDFVTLHGIVSWISAETRGQIVRFLARYLKPGGVVQLSYNAMASCAQVMPLQRLLTAHAKHRNEQWAGAAAFAQKLVAQTAFHFERNPDSKARVNTFADADQRYLVHEYMHEQWTPFHFTDIAAELADAKLTYAGSARFVQMAPVAWLTGEQAELVASIGDPVFAEEVRDFFCNRGFRSDVFVRGKATLTDARLREEAKHVYLWPVAGAQYRASVQLEHATIDRSEDAHRPLYDLLRAAPGELTLDQVLNAPQLAANNDINAIMQLVRFSIAAGETLIRYGETQPADAAERLNAVLLSRAELGDGWDALASPRMAGGVPVGLLDQLLMAAMQGSAGKKNDTDTIVERVQAALVRTGLVLRVGGEPPAPEDIPAALRKILADSGALLVANAKSHGLWATVE